MDWKEKINNAHNDRINEEQRKRMYVPPTYPRNQYVLAKIDLLVNAVLKRVELYARTDRDHRINVQELIEDVCNISECDNHKLNYDVTMIANKIVEKCNLELKGTYYKLWSTYDTDCWDLITDTFIIIEEKYKPY